MEFDMLNKFANTVAALGLASIVAGFALSAHAGETTDMAQFTCGDYLDLAPEDQATVIYWLDGYLSHKTSNLVIDFSTIQENIEILYDTCWDYQKVPVVDLVNDANQG
jgi:hypothetical protein